MQKIKDLPTSGLTRTLSENTGLHLSFLGVFALAVFGNSVFFDFVWDDTILYLGRDVYRNFDIIKIFTSQANGQAYLPVSDISFALDFLLWGNNPSGFHITNLALYVLNVLAVYFMTREIVPFLFSGQEHPYISAKNIAFFTSLLFLAHPVHSEAVCFVSCRHVLLSGLFFFLCCFFFLKFLAVDTHFSKKYYSIAFLCFVFAVFAKETAIITPIVLFLLVFIDNRKKARYIHLIPFFAVSLVSFFIFRTIASKAGLINIHYTSMPGGFSFLSKLSLASQIPFFYLEKLVFPVNFSVDYPDNFARFPGDPYVILSSLAVLFFLLSGFMLKNKYPEYIFSIVWFLVTLFPVLNFFLTHPVVADRYVYIPSYSFFFLTALLMSRLSRNMDQSRIMLIAGSVFVFWAVLSINRNDVWKSEVSLWENTIKTSPLSGTAYRNLGVIFFSQKDHDRAIAMFSRLKQINPSDISLEYHNAAIMYEKGDYSGVITLLNPVLTGDNNDLNALILMAKAFEKTGDVKNAIFYYLKAANAKRLDPFGEKKTARAALQKLQVRISPELNRLRNEVIHNPSDPDARQTLALALYNAGFYREAIFHYLELEKLGGSHWALYYNIAGAYEKCGMDEIAITYYEKCVALNPGASSAYNNLGIIYKKLGNFKQAIAAFEKAMVCDSSSGYAPFNLGVLYFQLGEQEKAMKYFSIIETSFPDLKNRTEMYTRQVR